MDFEKTYSGARVLLMEENYRSTPEILQSADRFIQKNQSRHPKTIHPTRASGANVHLISTVDRAVQFGWLAKVAEQGNDQTAILYRNNDSALPLIDLLDRRGIPYRCRQMDDTFFTHRIVTDILDILAFAHDPRNGEIFLRIYYKFGGGISRKAADFACQKSSATGMPILAALRSFPQLSQYARDHVPNLMGTLPKLLQDTALCGLNRIWKELRYMDYVEQMQLDANKYEILCLLAEQEPSLDALVERLDRLRQLVSGPAQSGGVILSTVHSSKGLEYDRVYLLDVLDGILPAQPGTQGYGGNEAISGGAAAFLCGHDTGQGPFVPVLLPVPQRFFYQGDTAESAGGNAGAGGRVRDAATGIVRQALSPWGKGLGDRPGLLRGAVHDRLPGWDGAVPDRGADV